MNHITALALTSVRQPRIRQSSAEIVPMPAAFVLGEGVALRKVREASPNPLLSSTAEAGATKACASYSL